MSHKVMTPITIPENPLDLAYLAGIIDGEGSIGIGTSSVTIRYSGTITVSIANTNPKLILWLQDKLGGKTYNRGKPTPESKAAFVWRVQGDNAVSVLNAVRSFLILKQEQADIVLAYHALRPSPGSGIQNKLTDETKIRRLELYTQLRVLNKKGDLDVAA